MPVAELAAGGSRTARSPVDGPSRRAALGAAAACLALVCALLVVGSARASSSTFGPTGSHPWSMAIDSAGTLYIPNSDSGTVSRITAAGTSTVAWATVGSEPYGIAVDAAGTVYVANRVSASVSRITSGGSAVVAWASTGAGTYPRAVAVDANGNVYTANTDTDTVTKVTSAGVVTPGWATTGDSPRAIAVDAAGNVYTANNGSNTVTKITPAGDRTLAWATTGRAPNGIAVDTAGNVYTPNYLDATVTKIAPDGSSSVFGLTGSGPYGITVDAAGNVYVANTGSNTVSRITAAGVSTVAWATTGAGTGPRGIAVDAAGNVYTANYDSNTVTKIAPDPPAAPTSLVATAGNASASIAFTAGADNGWAITNYEYSLDGGTTWTARSPASAASPIAIPGLANGTTYAITLRAVNAGGGGAASSAVDVTPVAAPAAPTELSATAVPGGVSVAFTAGADNGMPIVNYEYSLDDGTTWTARSPAGTTSPIAIGGLTDGTTYVVRLRAVNAVGAGAASSAVRVAVPAPPVPATPRDLRLSARTLRTGELLVATFTADGGTTYTITAAAVASKREARGTAARGRCSTKADGPTGKGIATCTIRLRRAGSWLVSITPEVNGVEGAPATRRVLVKRPVPARAASPAGPAEPVTG